MSVLVLRATRASTAGSARTTTRRTASTSSTRTAPYGPTQASSHKAVTHRTSGPTSTGKLPRLHFAESQVRVDTDRAKFRVFPIPEALSSTAAAPMLCAGLTAYSPLVRNGCGPGKKVGIVGLGGIGHFGVLFAKALGAEVWAISRSHAKEEDAKAMGADGFLATGDKDWNKAHEMTFDLIVNTANSSEGFDLDAYLSLLDVHGKWVSVGLPEGDGFQVRNQTFLANGCFFGSSHLGSRKETLAMLQLAADRGIKTWVEELPISDKSLADVMQRLHKNDVRYRFCMTNYKDQFGA